MSAPVPLPRQPAGTPWPTDDWPIGAPVAGVAVAALEQLLDHAFSDPAELPGTRAVVVVHRGRIVAERHADGTDETTTHVSWSMAKSILHAACGLLVGDGRLALHEPAGLRSWDAPGDPRRDITVAQLLEMRSGLRFLEDYTESDEKVRNVIEMLFGRGQADVAAYAADCPLEQPPGHRFYYSSGTSNLISSRLSDLLGPGEAVERWLRERLFDPIGMKSPSLRFDDAGTWIASSFVFATARDFARFGLLYLRDGIWDGVRQLPAGWVDYGRRLSDPAPDDTFSYGAHWWVVPGRLGTFQAMGYNGQRITVVPGLDLVIVRLGVTPVEFAPRLDAWMKALVDAFRGAGPG